MSTNRVGNCFAPARCLGGLERFAPAVAIALGRLATFAKNSGHVPERLLGKA